MNCYVCDKDIWHSMGDINPERELLVCMYCGNVAYRVDVAKEPEMLDYYRHGYRQAPNVGNLVTTNHKLQYIRVFMAEWLKEKKGKRCLVGDVGCATGYIPAFFRANGHRATGSEYTVTFRRFAENFYGIPIPEKLPTKHPYDLIIFYHTLEHMMEPDKKLAEHAALVKPGGHMLVSCPEWFDTLEEASGSAIQSFTHLFHKDHINVFSATSLKNLFIKAGLEVVKEDHVQYGQTYLLRKPEADIGRGVDLIVKENWKEMEGKIKSAKTAIELYTKGEFQKAIDAWPKFPEAWMGLVFNSYMKDLEKQQVTIAEGEKLLKDNARWRLAVAMWLYQTKNYEKAIGNYQWFMTRKPNENTAMSLGQAYFELGKFPEAFDAFEIAAEINPMLWQEAMNYMCRCAVSMPTWDEAAFARAKHEMAKSAPAPEFTDKSLDEPKPDAPLEVVK